MRLRYAALLALAAAAGLCLMSGCFNVGDMLNIIDDSNGNFTVTIQKVDEVGDILTDGGGMTLYTYSGDKAGESRCYGECAVKWPPLLVAGEPTAPHRISREVGVTARSDGGMQVTYRGRPLYRYFKDKMAGNSYGHGVNGEWFIAAVGVQ